MPPSPSSHPAQTTPEGPEATPGGRHGSGVALLTSSEHFRLPEDRIITLGGHIDP